MPRKNNIQLRKGSSTEWTDVNPVLASGEPGFEIDSNRLKIGKGINWDDTDYISSDSLLTTVYNNTGSTISGFNVVYINGGQGNKPTISLSIANAEATSSKTYGITVGNIPNQSSGLVITNGSLKKLNTNIFGTNQEGASLWLSPTVSGGITLTKPYAPDHMVYVGTIIRSHNTQGVIEVRIQNGYELEELHNVATTGATNGQFLQYNSSSGLWIPSSSGDFLSLSVNNSPVYNSNNLPNPITGIGTSGYVGKWISSSGISSGIIYDNGTSIGIGTTSPSGRFDVAGDVYVRGTGNNLGTIYFKSTAGIDTTHKVRVDTNGNLYLDSGGSFFRVGSQDGAAEMQALSTFCRIGHGYDANSTNQNIQFRPANIERMRITNSGLVGIGTTAPSGQLHVVGTGIFSNIAINANTASVGANNYSLLVDGDVSIGSGNTGRTLSIWGNSTTKKLVLKNVNGNSFVTYSIGSQDLNLGGPQPTDYPFNNINYYAGSSNGFHRFHVSPDGTGISPVAVITSSGLGIGTTAPNSQLHVIGSGIFSSGIIVGNSSTNGYLYGPSGNANIQFNNGGSNRLDLTSTNIYLAGSIFLNGTSYVNGTLTFPKISTPTSTATQSNPNELRFYNGLWNGSSAYDGYNTIHSIASTSVSGASRLAFLINNGDGTQNRTERLSILSNGIVGIGTNSPQTGFMLDVVGAAVIRGNIATNGTIQEFGNSRYQIHNGTSSNQVTYFCNGGGRFGIGFTAPSGLVAISGGVSIGPNYNVAPPTNGLIIEGSVGIGTTNPGYKLQVNGSFGATTKSFRIDHPSKKGYSLEYGSLESPYHGVRLTGRGKVNKGAGIVKLPDYLKDLIHDDESVNIQITNIKHSKTLFIDKIELKKDRFIVKAHRAKTLGDLEFFWTLTGVRKDVDHLVVEKEN